MTQLTLDVPAIVINFTAVIDNITFGAGSKTVYRTVSTILFRGRARMQVTQRVSLARREDRAHRCEASPAA